jgi:putative Mg2+ transporter-C (MgtC) family protein
VDTATVESISQLGILAKVALAMFLGGLIGVERELADKPAGLRTQMLVAGAASLFVGLGPNLVHLYDGLVRPGSVNVQSDPVRIVEAIITGVSFLGAGTIFRRHASEQVQGLTTAACILMSAAVGICVALQQHVLAIGVTMLVLAALRGLGFIEEWIARRNGKAGLPNKEGHESAA